MKTNAPTDLGSLVQLSDLLLDGSAKFNHLAWQTKPTFTGTSARDDLASVHEWCHNELDNTTTYGLLLVYYSTLTHHAIDDRACFEVKLLELVAHCEVAHEVYATWYSVELLRAQYDIDVLTGLLPSDYEAYYAYGERIVSGIDSPFLRRQAFITIIRACFEAASFAEFSFQKSDEFSLSDIRARDLPNQRLELILKLAPAASFSKWADAYCDQAIEHDSAAIRRAITHTGADGFESMSIDEADLVLGKFLSWLTSELNKKLWAAELANNPYESHLNRLQQLADDANKRCQKIVIKPSVGGPNESPDSLQILLRQADSEIVGNREHALSLFVTPINDLPRERWPDLAVGNDPKHLLLQARPMLSLRQQHICEPQAFIDAPDESPVVFVRHREPSENASDEHARAFSITELSDLEEVVCATNEAMRIGLVSSQLLDNPEWQSKWLIPSLLWVIKIDHSLHEFLHEHCRAQAEVRYTTSTINDGLRIIRFMCFLTLAKGESNWQLFIGFCSDNTAKACIGFITHSMDADQIIRDDIPFNTDLAPALRIVATHLIRDEYFFSFEHLSYL